MTLEPTTGRGPHGPPLRDETDEFGSLTDASLTGAYLRQVAVQHAVLVEVAKRRLDHLPGLLETLERDVVLLTAGGREHVDALGAFAPAVWRHGRRRVHELFVNADRRLVHPAVRTAEGVLITLLHEACHLYACIWSIRDTYRGGRYHNRRFGEIAVVLGLTVVPRPAVGLETPALATWARDEYADLLTILDRSLVLAREPVGAPVTAGHRTETAATLAEGCVETRPTRRRTTGSEGRILPQEPPEDAMIPPGFHLCPSGKRVYADETAAVAALRAIRRRAEPDRKKGTTESAAYPCRTCGRWHLTAAQQTKRRTRSPRSRSRH